MIREPATGTTPRRVSIPNLDSSTTGPWESDRHERNRTATSVFGCPLFATAD